MKKINKIETIIARIQKRNCYEISSNGKKSVIALEKEEDLHIFRSLFSLLPMLQEFKQEKQELFDQLSKREKQVLFLLAKGQSNQEVAGALFISKLTVKTHRRNINKKLKIQHPIELFLYATAFKS